MHNSIGLQRFAAIPSSALFVVFLLAFPGQSAATAFGTLSNFDVVNDTPGPCHGFEIELEDIHKSDVPYTFGGSYIRYGDPEISEDTSDPAHPRVIVRYRRWNGTQWEATPVAPLDITPGGHACYAGGPVGNYESSGCEHYGVSLSASPTRTTYRWIVASDPSDMNTSFSTVPQNVNLPVPVWNVVPIPVANGGGVNVVAEVEPVEEENHAQYGEPQWMKVFKIQSELDLQPEDLVRLLLGVAGGIVPDDETEVETEWKLIQSKPGDAEGEEEDADIKEEPLDDGKHSVVRRYEFYAYTGPRDPEKNEAEPCVNDDEPVPADAPIDGCSDLGAFVGAQNVAVDVDLAAIDSDLPAGEIGVAYNEIALVVGGLPPYTVVVVGTALPDGMVLDSATGVLSGTPTAGGDFTFTIDAQDSATDTVHATFTLSIAAAGGATATPTEVAPEPTATPTETPTLTATLSVETPTPTATSAAETPTASPTTATAICTGNCNGDGSVAISELITLVNIALEKQPASACAGGIASGETVDIAFLVRAVNNALRGCVS